MDHSPPLLLTSPAIRSTAYNEPWEQLRETLHGVLDNLAVLHSLRTGEAPRLSASQRFRFGDGDGGDGGGARVSRWVGAAHLSARAVPAAAPPREAPRAAPRVDRVPSRLAGVLDTAPSDIAVVVVFDGLEKMSPTLFGDVTRGSCILSPEDGAALAAAAAALPARSPDSTMRDAHLLQCEWHAEVAHGHAYAAPLNLMLLIKQANGGKLNSHVWALRGLAPFADRASGRVWACD